MCESACWENSKSLHKPNIKKHQKARMKRDKNDVWFLFSHFMDSWYPRLPDKWRFITLETRKKTVAGWDLFGLGRYFWTPSWRCRRAEIFLVGICWNWNCPSPTMAYSKASFLEFLYIIMSWHSNLCTFTLWELGIWCFHQYLSCPWTPLDSLSTLGGGCATTGHEEDSESWSEEEISSATPSLEWDERSEIAGRCYNIMFFKIIELWML